MSDVVAELLRARSVVAVLSAPNETRLYEWALAVAGGGVRLLAVPAQSPSVTELTAELIDEAGLFVGVSDVVGPQHLSVALAAGAHFVLCPIVDAELVRAAQDRGLAVLAGAATPSEVAAAAKLGVELVVIHPASRLGGPAYLRGLAELFPKLGLIASGGVDTGEAPGYLEAGARAVVVDRGLFPTDDDPAAADVIRLRARALVEVCEEVMSGRPSARPPYESFRPRS